jgi:heme-degrading monooxygenase HmoA
MVTVGMHYDVLPGREERFEGAVRDIVAQLQSAAGHTWTRLYRDVERPGSYLIYSEWADREAFMEFIRSPAFAGVTRWGREEIIAGPPRHHILTAE